MRKILVHVALSGSTPKRSSLEVLSHVSREVAGQGDEVIACLLGSSAADAVQETASYGADRVITVTNEAFDSHLNAVLLSGIEQVVRHVSPSVIVFASSESIKDVLGSLAVRLNAAVLPDVIDFSIGDSEIHAARPVMAAKSIARETAKADMVLVSVRSGSFEAVANSKEAVVEFLDFTWESRDSMQQLVRVIQGLDGTVDLSEARVVVAAGRGVKDQDGKKLVEDLAALFSGGIGASRAVVEMDLFPATAQIGQTGKVVAPDLYFALGISGAIQHVAGMINSRVIVAINKDQDAPIFDYATYGIVGDLYKIVPLLIEQVKLKKQLA